MPVEEQGILPAHALPGCSLVTILFCFKNRKRKRPPFLCIADEHTKILRLNGMDKEQSGNRNSAGPAVERTLKNQQRITGGIREERGIIRQPITRRS
jgi:hypothetical protein